MIPAMAVTGLGAVHGDPADFSDRLRPLAMDSLGSLQPDFDLPENQLRRMDAVSQWLVAAAKIAVSHAGGNLQGSPEQMGLVVSTRLGTFRSIYDFSLRIFSQGMEKANPMDFPNTVLNASAGNVCMVLGLRGPSNTLAGPGSLAEAWDVLALEHAQAMLAAGMEEAAEPQRQVERSLGRVGGGLSSGAAVLLLENGMCAQQRRAVIHAWCLGYAAGFHSSPGHAWQSLIPPFFALQQADAEHIDGTIVAVEPEARQASLAALSVLGLDGNVLVLEDCFGRLAGAAEAFGGWCACQILAQGRWPQVLTRRAFAGRRLLLLSADAWGSHYAYLFGKAGESYS